MFESDRYDSPEEAAFVEVKVFLTDTGGGHRPGPGESLEYRTEDIDATAGADYRSTAGTVRFEVGEESKTIRIPLLDDAEREGVETFRVHARNTLGGNWSATTVFLEDGETPPPPDPFASTEAAAAPESAPAAAERSEDGPSRLVEGSMPGQAESPPIEAPTAVQGELQVGSGFELATGVPAASSDETADHDSGSLWPIALGGGTALLVAGASILRGRSRWSPTQP